MSDDRNPEGGEDDSPEQDCEDAAEEFEPLDDAREILCRPRAGEDRRAARREFERVTAGLVSSRVDELIRVVNQIVRQYRNETPKEFREKAAKSRRTGPQQVKEVRRAFRETVDALTRLEEVIGEIGQAGHQGLYYWLATDVLPAVKTSKRALSRVVLPGPDSVPKLPRTPQSKFETAATLSLATFFAGCLVHGKPLTKQKVHARILLIARRAWNDRATTTDAIEKRLERVRQLPPQMQRFR